MYWPRREINCQGTKCIKYSEIQLINCFACHRNLECTCNHVTV